MSHVWRNNTLTMNSSSFVVVSLTAATVLDVSTNCRRPSPHHKTRYYENLWSKRSYRKRFFFFKFYYLITATSNIQIIGSLFLGQLHSWLVRLLFLPISSFGYSRYYLAFLGCRFPSWKTSGPQGTCCVWDYGVTTLGGRLRPRQYKNKSDAKKSNISNA